MIDRLHYYGIKTIKKEPDTQWDWDEMFEFAHLYEEPVDEHCYSLEDLIDYCLQHNIECVFYEENIVYREELMIELEATYSDTLNRLRSVYPDINEEKMRTLFLERTRSVDALISTSEQYHYTLKAYYLDKCMNYEYDIYSACLLALKKNLAMAMERAAFARAHHKDPTAPSSAT